MTKSSPPIMINNAMASQMVIIVLANVALGSKTEIHSPTRVLIMDTKTARIKTRAILRTFIAVEICV